MVKIDLVKKVNKIFADVCKNLGASGFGTELVCTGLAACSRPSRRQVINAPPIE